MSDPSNIVWIWLAKCIGAITGSAISIAYMLPKGRWEAAIKFFIGLSTGVVFGGATGIKIAYELGIRDALSEAELSLIGSAFASLCAWWVLGLLARIAERLSNSQKN